MKNKQVKLLVSGTKYSEYKTKGGNSAVLQIKTDKKGYEALKGKTLSGLSPQTPAGQLAAGVQYTGGDGINNGGPTSPVIFAERGGMDGVRQLTGVEMAMLSLMKASLGAEADWPGTVNAFKKMHKVSSKLTHQTFHGPGMADLSSTVGETRNAYCIEYVSMPVGPMIDGTKDHYGYHNAKMKFTDNYEVCTLLTFHEEAGEDKYKNLIELILGTVAANGGKVHVACRVFGGDTLIEGDTTLEFDHCFTLHKHPEGFSPSNWLYTQASSGVFSTQGLWFDSWASLECLKEILKSGGKVPYGLKTVLKKYNPDMAKKVIKYEKKYKAA